MMWSLMIRDSEASMIAKLKLRADARSASFTRESNLKGSWQDVGRFGAT